MRVIYAAMLSFALLVSAGFAAAAPQGANLPAQVSDAEFWRLFTEFSEPTGDYPYENFISNEETVQDVVGLMTRVTKPGGAYLGVATEQNFTYIAAIRPKIAFIIDIRRQNAIEHFLYKAIFEMSPTRGDFVSNLFSIRPATKAPAAATAAGVFLSIDGVKADRALYTQNLAAIKASFSKHGFALTADDVKKVELIFDVFFRAGPQIDYKFESSFPPNMAPAPNYIQAMTDTDGEKKPWSFLASEDNYRVVRDMQLRNLIIPVVGDFAGPKAIRSVAAYLKQRNAVVSAFYLSNVEYYLDHRNFGGSLEKTMAFYQNAATLPVDRSSLFVRFVGATQSGNLSWWRRGGWLQVVSPIADLNDRIKAGATSYSEAVALIPDPKALVP